MQGDPVEIKARFSSICPETGRAINKGDKCIYYPRERKAYHVDSRAAENYRALIVAAAFCLGDSDW